MLSVELKIEKRKFCQILFSTQEILQFWGNFKISWISITNVYCTWLLYSQLVLEVLHVARVSFRWLTSSLAIASLCCFASYISQLFWNTQFSIKKNIAYKYYLKIQIIFLTLTHHIWEESFTSQKGIYQRRHSVYIGWLNNWHVY